MAICDKLNGKRVLILGFGREGRSTLEYIEKNCTGVTVGIADSGFVDTEALGDGYSYHLGAEAESAIELYDITVKSPGVVLKSAHDMEKITSQTELFLGEHRGITIGVSGTKGKSTTASLIAHILRKKYESVFLAGNIGVPVLDIEGELTKNSLVVFELSCHQLQYASVSPHTAVYLNLYPEHLDHYGTFEAYAAAKENLIKFQNENDFAFIGEGCGVTGRAQKIEPLSLPLDAKKVPLAGAHNLYNISVAAGVGALYGVPQADISEAVYTFTPLAHRLEPLGIVDGVRYYNDSISTIPQTAIEGLKSLDGVHTLILGGMDRGISYAPLVKYLCENPVSLVIVMPDTGSKIAMGLGSMGFGGRVLRAADLTQAVALAKEQTPKGETVLFSPAAASYGFFKNFEERGNKFKELLKKEG